MNPSSSPEVLEASPGEARAELGSGRLRLRPIEDTDAPGILRIDSDDRVQQFLLDQPLDTLMRVLAAITHAQCLRAETHYLGVWAALDQLDQFLGYFSLMPTADGEVELGVKLSPEHWGRFYALAGGRLLCQYASEVTALPGLVGIFAADNQVIPILLKRLGFSYCDRILHFGQPAVRFRLTF